MVGRTHILDHLAGPAFDEMMALCGYYKHSWTWRRKGRVTMRGIGSEGPGQLAATIARERARRFFDSASAEDVDKELSRFRTAAEVALDELVRTISPDDGFAQQAHVLRVEKAAKALAAGVEEPAVRETAYLVAVLRLEVAYADSLYFRMVRRGHFGTRPSREILSWKEKAGRRLESMIRTLAYMKRCAFSDVEASVRRLKLAAG
jgi:hypothetical protein